MSRGQTLFAGVCPLLSFLPIFRTAAHTALQHPNMSHDTMVSKSNHSFMVRMDKIHKTTVTL